jgi:hypothetical protein
VTRKGKEKFFEREIFISIQRSGKEEGNPIRYWSTAGWEPRLYVPPASDNTTWKENRARSFSRYEKHPSDDTASVAELRNVGDCASDGVLRMS